MVRRQRGVGLTATSEHFTIRIRLQLNRHTEIKKGLYVYYHCIGYGNRHKVTYVPEHVIEAQFAGIVKRVTLPHDWYQFIRASMDKELKTHKLAGEQDRVQLQRERDRIQ